MGQAKTGELKRAARQLGVTSTTLRQHGWKTASPARVKAVQDNPPDWLLVARGRRHEKRARQTERRDHKNTAARLGVQVRAVKDRDIKPGEAEGLLAARPGWLIVEQERRQSQIERKAKDQLRRELTDAPRPLETALKQLRHLYRERSRRTRGSSRYTDTNQKISRLQRRIADIRGHHIHVLTSDLAKTHGEIAVEGLDAAGMLRQKGLTGARARRRGLSDSALGETRRQLGYKSDWYGSRLLVADRWYPSSKTCHTCKNVQEIGWAEHWTCAGCGARHQRDDNAAINLARYEDTSMSGDIAVGPVRAAVKRRADRRTGPRPAVGDEARKGTSHKAGEQPRDGVPTG